MRYMVVETFKRGAAPVYERARSRGRLLPAGLEYVDSWVDATLGRCFQLMETDDRRLLDEWMAAWEDLVEFEVVAVLTSAEAAAHVAAQARKGNRGWQARRRRAEGDSGEYPSSGRATEAEPMSEYLVVIEHEGESWGAYCPDLPGVGVVGDSQEEVEQLIREAITFHLDGLRQAGEPIPKPTAVGTTLVEVPAA
jgi:predicted RNase H-like HicB family nuclease